MMRILLCAFGVLLLPIAVLGQDTPAASGITVPGQA